MEEGWFAKSTSGLKYEEISETQLINILKHKKDETIIKDEFVI